ncbi:hypothetical protein [Vibrio parahaemolyticus]|uniref:hypothetical protein n=1 Tax=Vibrio parahaemolyticus TaxID=670 RepID=UPI00226B47D3|nr:hypothetical protein [Vibrio parahaemolyticus]MCX8819497.1 hypothetical protein [Vibrio parahaemolyticus]HDM8239165.1 hypothetical protein [Vibrio campbellii]
MNYLVIILLVIIMLLIAAFDFLVYSVFSLGYFIQDTWMWWLLAFSILGLFSAEKAGKSFSVCITLIIGSAILWSEYHITDTEKQQVISVAQELGGMYKQMGATVDIDGPKVTNTFTFPLPKHILLSDVDEVEDSLDSAIERMLGPQFRNFRAYRELELTFEEFLDHGGEIKTIIKDSKGEEIFAIQMEGFQDYALTVIAKK